MSDGKLVHNTLVQHSAYERAWKRLGKVYNRAATSRDPICLALVGESRTGKSRLIEEFIASHTIPRADEGKCVPVLYVTATANPTAPGLAQTMLRAIGDPRWNKDAEREQTFRLYRLLKESECRMVVVDEFQQVYDKNSDKVCYAVADWLKRLADETSTALVVSGLPRCRAVISQNEQLAGRFQASLTMPRFDWNLDEDRDEFIGILDAFCNQILTRFEIPQLSEQEMAFRFYCATGGLMGYLTKLLNEAVTEAAEEHRTKIALKHIREAHQEATWMDYGAEEAMSPFDPKFSVAPSEDLLRRVKSIGTTKDLPPPRPRTRRRAPKLESASQALSAS